MAQFLSSEEDEKLKHIVQNMTREHYETTAAYGGRFRKAVEDAYPLPVGVQREQSETKQLVEFYIKGLNNEPIKIKLIAKGYPATYELAIAKVAELEANHSRIQMAREKGLLSNPPAPTDRLDEPMEVGAMIP